MQLIIKLTNKAISSLNFAKPVMMLILRLWIAKVFFSAGLVKINDFSGTVWLFANEYSVPFLPPMLAAVFATIFELSCSTLIALGLASRLATLPLIVMTAVINFTYQDNIEHYYWVMLLGTILFYGADKLSLDYIISKKVKLLPCLSPRQTSLE